MISNQTIHHLDTNILILRNQHCVLKLSSTAFFKFEVVDVLSWVDFVIYSYLKAEWHHMGGIDGVDRNWDALSERVDVITSEFTILLTERPQIILR